MRSALRTSSAATRAFDTGKVDTDLGRQQEQPIHRVAREGHGSVHGGVGKLHARADGQQREHAVEAGAVAGREQLLGVAPAAGSAKRLGQAQVHLEGPVVGSDDPGRTPVRRLASGDPDASGVDRLGVLTVVLVEEAYRWWLQLAHGCRGVLVVIVMHEVFPSFVPRPCVPPFVHVWRYSCRRGTGHGNAMLRARRDAQ